MNETNNHSNHCATFSKSSHLLFHCHTVMYQTGHRHLEAEHWQLRDGSAHQRCASPEPACAHCSLSPQACHDRHRLFSPLKKKKGREEKNSPLQVICHGAVEIIITSWHQGATEQSGWATPGHGSWPGHREKGCSSSRSYTLHWSPSPPQRHQTQLCEEEKN